jgi:hypothetical protein
MKKLTISHNYNQNEVAMWEADFLKHPAPRGPVGIFPDILKEHERIGCDTEIMKRTGCKIPISRKDKKKTINALKRFLVSLGGSSKEARSWFKKNYVVFDAVNGINGGRVVIPNGITKQMDLNTKIDMPEISIDTLQNL